MVASIHCDSRSLYIDAPEKKKGESFFSKCAQLNAKIKSFLCPGWFASIAFRWGAVMPLAPRDLTTISQSQDVIGDVRSTFELPELLLDQVRLVGECSELSDGTSKLSLFQKIRKVFVLAINSIAIEMKLILFCIKTRLIKVSKSSSELATSLKSGVALLMLGVSLDRFCDAVWQLGSLVRRGRFTDGQKLSREEIGIIVRAASAFFSLVVSVLSVGALFLGWSVPPILLLSLATISFALVMTSLTLRKTGLLWEAGVYRK